MECYNVDMKPSIISVDTSVINACKAMSFPIARIAIFVVYFWFGVLKVVGASPANPLVASLLHATLPFLSFDSFIIGFGIFEAVIGILFLFKKFDRLSILLFVIHMLMTTMVLVMLPAMAWDGTFVPSLEGQYVIKNIALVALVVSLASHIEPMRRREHSV